MLIEYILIKTRLSNFNIKSYITVNILSLISFHAHFKKKIQIAVCGKSIDTEGCLRILKTIKIIE